ncbi:MAG: ABC-F family ATP-binding cassette domain-containing protein [Waddliaceae bacterium]
MNLTMRFGGKILFKNAQLQLDPAHRYGLVGANGSGKSTLIRLLNGELTPDGGGISHPSQAAIGSLEQDYFHLDDTLILSIVLQGRPELWKAMERKNELFSKNTFTRQECEVLEKLEAIFEQNGGYAAEAEAAKLLEGLGIKESFHEKNLSTLSGGFKLRVMLAKLLFSNPDILLLDEPTNHLDLPSIKWLESYLIQFQGIALVSSHDRIFLNAICTDIIDLDHQTLTLFKGNYDAFEKSKEMSQIQRESELSNQEKKRDHIQGFIDKFRAKSSKARQAQSKMHLVRKLEKEMESLNLPPSSRLYPKFRFEQCRSSGAIPLKAQELCKAYGSRRVLNRLSFAIEREDRVCFVGPNGIGKSTLLNILASELSADSGGFEWGFAVKYAYFPQDHSKEVQRGLSMLEWLAKAHPTTPEQRLREILARALFTKESVDKPVDVLSGGETARLILTKMMLLEHNVLLLDEPTNHLDIEGTDALIQALQNYPGTLLIVSHNRYFISRIATRIIEMQPDGIKDFRGTYQEYVAQSEQDVFLAHIDEEKTASDKRDYHQHKESRKRETKLKKQIAACEERSHVLEKEIATINERLLQDNFYETATQEEMERVLKLKKTAEEKLNSTIEEWERLTCALNSPQSFVESDEVK